MDYSVAILLALKGEVIALYFPYRESLDAIWNYRPLCYLLDSMLLIIDCPKTTASPDQSSVVE